MRPVAIVVLRLLRVLLLLRRCVVHLVLHLLQVGCTVLLVTRLVQDVRLVHVMMRLLLLLSA